MKSRRQMSRNARAAKQRPGTNYDLQFVPVGTAGARGGGWYRKLPGDRIEVMSRGRLEQVQLGDADPEEKAKAVVREILDHAH